MDCAGHPEGQGTTTARSSQHVDPGTVSAAQSQSRSVRVGEVLRGAPDTRLRELVGALGPERAALAYLEELRWPHGVSCPRCASEQTGWLERREKHYCRACRYQFRVSAGTVFHDSHVSPARWLAAVRLMLEAERGFPANRLREAIGGSYKTAWFVGHRIRAAMSRSLLDPGTPLALAHDLGERAGDAAPTASVSAGLALERWVLVRRLVAGAYHRPSLEHLSAYWNESRWRAAHLDDAHVFRETARALLAAEPLPYRELVDHTRPLGA